MANAELKRFGFDSRIDRRTYEEQGIEKVPTVHMGAAASQMERKGIRTERGNQNREIGDINKEIRQARARIKQLKDWVYKQPIADVPLSDMLSAINAAQNMKSKWKKIAGLQMSAKVLMFLQENKITSMEQLADKVTELNQRQYDLAGNIKSKERRISKLNEHLSQVDIYNQHKAVYKKYKELDPKKREAYKEKHAEEIGQYESASAYLKANLNGYGKIPEKDWRTERDKLLAERYALVDEFYKLKDDVKNVETLRRGAENIMREEVRQQQPTKTKGVEL